MTLLNRRPPALLLSCEDSSPHTSDRSPIPCRRRSDAPYRTRWNSVPPDTPGGRYGAYFPVSPDAARNLGGLARTSVEPGKRVSVRLGIVGRRLMKTKNTTSSTSHTFTTSETMNTHSVQAFF